MRRQTLTWTLTGVSCLLGFMMTVQIASRPHTSASSLTSYLDVSSQIDEAIQERKLIESDLAKQRAQLAQYKAAEGSQRELEKAFRKDEQTVAKEAGLSALTGAGLTITIKDDPKLPFVPEYAGQFAKNADQLISQIVNDLYANGATAISINDQRLVTTSSIRLVQGLGPDAILQVNTDPITSPYVIRAIGPIGRMQAALTVDNVALVLQLMQEDCIVRAHNWKHPVRVPAYHGALPGQFAKEVTTP